MFKDSPDPNQPNDEAELDDLLEQGASLDPNGWERAPARSRSRWGAGGGCTGLGRMFGAVLALIVLVALAGVVGGATGALPSGLSKLR
jgi:hypothetical protein